MTASNSHVSFMPMKIRTTVQLSLAWLLAGCASHEGTYTPDCIAFAGNEIELNGGRFVWDKFTDQVLVNDAGEVVDQFPEYPLRGRYQVEDETLHFESYTGEALPDMHLRREGTRTFLLTEAQLASWQKTGELAGCALVQGGHQEDPL